MCFDRSQTLLKARELGTVRRRHGADGLEEAGDFAVLRFVAAQALVE